MSVEPIDIGPSHAIAAPRPGTPLPRSLLLVVLVCTALLFGWAAAQGQIAVLLAMTIAVGLFGICLYRSEVGIFVFMSTMMLTYPDILQGVGPLTINNLLGVFYSLLLLTQVYRSRDTWFMRANEVRIFIMLGGLFLFSTALAEIQLPDLQHQFLWAEENRFDVAGYMAAKDYTVPWMGDFMTRVAFLIFFINFITTRRHVWWVLVVLLGCIFIAVPPALYDYIVYGGGEESRVSGKLMSIKGWTGNANRFAFMCLLGICLMFYFIHLSRRTSIKILLLVGVIMLVTLVLLAASRSGFIGLVLLGIWLFIRGGAMRRSGLRLGVALLAISAALTFTTLAPDDVQERLLNLNPLNPEGEGTHSTEKRTATIRQSINIFTDHPWFGIGLGNFRWVNLWYHFNNKPPHNSYLWALAEGGLFCLLLYLACFGMMIRRLNRIRKDYLDDPVLPHVGELITAYLLLFLFFSLFADVWLIEIHIYLLAGLCIVLSRLTSNRRRRVWDASASPISSII